MSGKYVKLMFSEKYGWWLSWGNETFYDEDRSMLTWDRAIDAARWAQTNHPELMVVGEMFDDGETEFVTEEQLGNVPKGKGQLTLL